jgi:multiple antibiotic resistance protein
VELLAPIVTMFLVMDPLGNVPLFLSVLRAVDPARRRTVLVREVIIAYGVLIAFLLGGRYLMRFLGLEQSAIGIAGGIVLFLIALRMIFPSDTGMRSPSVDGEPFIVPLAIPLIAGPSALATVLLLQSSTPPATLFVALTIAWAITGAILVSSTFLYRILGERGLIALERLMGMLLVMVAVQMLLNGLGVFLARR